MSHGDQVSPTPPGFKDPRLDPRLRHRRHGRRETPDLWRQFHPESLTRRMASGCFRISCIRFAAAKAPRPADRVRELQAVIRRKAGSRRVLFSQWRRGFDGRLHRPSVPSVRSGGAWHLCRHRFHAAREGRRSRRPRAPQLRARVASRRRFFQALRGVTDPEEKRKIIGSRSSRRAGRRPGQPAVRNRG
jgi:hypothetical protein